MDNPNFENNKNDALAIMAKGLFGSIPGIGNLIAEVVGELIPNQRMDRIGEFLIILSLKVANLEKESLKNKFQKKEYLDLFEDAAFQATRALSKERLEHIANALKNSLTKDEVFHLFSKKLLWLLGEINESEVLLLTGYYYPSYTEKGGIFWEIHKDALQIPFISKNSSEKEIEEAVLKSSFKERLVQLELIKPRYKMVKIGDIPEFDDKTGQMKSSGYEITKLGRMLFEFINESINNK